jgi:hypothetical protein
LCYRHVPVCSVTVLVCIVMVTALLSTCVELLYSTLRFCRLWKREPSCLVFPVVLIFAGGGTISPLLAILHVRFSVIALLLSFWRHWCYAGISVLPLAVSCVWLGCRFPLYCR